jgi:LysR family transcriptional regulator for metE and metH
MLELRHLRTLHALRDHGSLAAAAEQLCLTPSALSHQLRELEQWLDLSLVDRKSRPVQFSAAGLRLLQLADQVLPQVTRTRSDLHRMAHGQTGRLLLASECHSCFDWLMPVLNRYRPDWPDVDLDFASGFEPEPHVSLKDGDIDLLITTDALPVDGIAYTALFDYESRLVLAPTHPLAQQDILSAADVAAQTLISYPVDPERLDIVAGWLAPLGLKPAYMRRTELTPMLIQLVASERGVAALPDWVVADYERRGWVMSRRIPVAGGEGLKRTLYAAYRQADQSLIYLDAFLKLMVQMTRSSRPIRG